MYSFILVQICGINCAASANVLVVIFLVTPGKCKLQKHGYGYKALGQRSGDELLHSAILHWFSFVSNRPSFFWGKLQET